VIKKKNISKKDLNTWKDYIKDPKDIFDKEDSSKHVTYNRFRFDLHGYTLSDANNKVSNLIKDCFNKSYREILLITGKGIHSNTDSDVFSSKDLSKLRYSIPEFINSNQELSDYISSIKVADNKEGGEGAIIIKLKSLKNKL